MYGSADLEQVGAAVIGDGPRVQQIARAVAPVDVSDISRSRRLQRKIAGWVAASPKVARSTEPVVTPSVSLIDCPPKTLLKAGSATVAAEPVVTVDGSTLVGVCAFSVRLGDLTETAYVPSSA